MDVAGISSAAVAVKSADVSNQVSVAVAAKNLDQMEDMGEGIKKMMEMSVQPNIGRNIDISV